MCSIELTDSLYLHKYNTNNSLFPDKHWYCSSSYNKSCKCCELQLLFDLDNCLNCQFLPLFLAFSSIELNSEKIQLIALWHDRFLKGFNWVDGFINFRTSYLLSANGIFSRWLVTYSNPHAEFKCHFIQRYLLHIILV